jgi:glycosyltransferase involved in cell wall biosynthesis
LPFWIEDERVHSDSPPADFDADFIFLARREDDKGLRELIRATGILAKEVTDLRVRIAGPGCCSPFKTLADECGASENISFCSLPGRADAMQALSRSRFLVLPSYHEGYPLSLLEAAQYSVPVIATDVGSIREVFGECEGCCIIPPRDVDSLVVAMKSRFEMESGNYIAARRAVHMRFAEISSEVTVRHRLMRTLFGEQSVPC